MTPDPTPLELFRTFGLALLLGALIGLERQRAGAHIAGLRTFTLIALLGALLGFLAQATGTPWLVGAGLLGIIVLAVMGNLLQARRRPDPGLTTEVAMLVAFGVGALIHFGQELLAVVVSFAATAILYFKPHLHAFSRKVEQRDIYAIFQFGLVTFIILPILPNRDLGPFGALNPYHIWLMVVLISGLSLVGYVVLKVVGARWGTPVLGLLGGIVSSTATTLAFSRHAKREASFSRSAAVVVILASTVVMLRVAVEVAVINPALLRTLGPVIAAMFGAGLLAAALAWRQSQGGHAPLPEPSNPAELRSAVTFGLLYGLVLLCVSAGKHSFGAEGVYLVSLISGLTDVDAITLSSARLAGTGVIPPAQACNAIVIAVLANLGFKLALVRVIGTAQMARWTSFGFAGIALAGLLTLLL